MRLRRPMALPLALVLLVGLAACGDDDDDGGTTETGDAATYTVQVDGESDEFIGEFATFAPNDLSVHPGDTVRFELPRFSGIAHTVTLGTLVDAAVAKYNALGPTSSIEAQETAPEVVKVPDVFPHSPLPGTPAPPPGPPKANQSAAQPCFLASGEPPGSVTGGAEACAEADQPDFDGTQTFFNSGVLNDDGDSFEMTVADDTAPGTYDIICLIHRGAMTAKLTVAPPAEEIPTPAEASARGERQFDALVAKVAPAATALRAATPDKALAGGGDPTVPNVVVTEFGPKDVNIPVGGTVTWSGFAFHTVSLNASDADIGVLSQDGDGSWQFSPKLAPEGIQLNFDPAAFPPAANGKPALVDMGRWDGTGKRSSGLFGSLPPVFVSVKQTFTKAGTYTVQCLVHPDMEGTVTVG